jgi:molybdopterin-binding protein
VSQASLTELGFQNGARATALFKASSVILAVAA